MGPHICGNMKNNRRALSHCQYHTRVWDTSNIPQDYIHTCCMFRGARDRVNMRILQTMLSGRALALEPECRILLFIPGYNHTILDHAIIYYTIKYHEYYSIPRSNIPYYIPSILVFAPSLGGPNGSCRCIQDP